MWKTYLPSGPAAWAALQWHKLSSGRDAATGMKGGTVSRASWNGADMVGESALGVRMLVLEERRNGAATRAAERGKRALRPEGLRGMIP